jgi:hypothetical protein
MPVAVAAVSVKSDCVGAACTAIVVGSQAVVSELVPIAAIEVGAPKLAPEVGETVGDTKVSGRAVDAVLFPLIPVLVGNTPIAVVVGVAAVVV